MVYSWVDRWWRSVLSPDLTRLCNAGIRDVHAELAECGVLYRDDAHWLNRRLRGQRLEEPLDLPRDHPRPSRRSGRGRVVSRSIGSRERAGLSRLCREEGGGACHPAQPERSGGQGSVGA